MMRSATARLAGSYLAIIMAMSIGFSLILYHLSSVELNRGLRRPPSFVVQLPSQPFSYEQFRQDRLTESNEHLRGNLIVFNIATLALGGILSYVLARRSLEPIEAAMEAQSRFTADASHELRTPLTAMQTEIEVNLRNPKLTRDQAIDLLKSNLEEVGKLRALSDGLLRLAQSGDQPLMIDSVSAKTLGTEAMQRVASLAEVKQITINNSIPELTLSADRETLIEILVILLDNAIKYSDPKKTVTLSAVQQNHQTLLRVTDEGYGITEQDQEHIFERFYRTDESRSKKKSEGYGLGLAIAQQIAELHQGSVSVKSEIAKGSTFTLTIPTALSQLRPAR
jgi:two-component system sensor histidine kinase CiaH